jgi:hypothetical protein
MTARQRTVEVLRLAEALERAARARALFGAGAPGATDPAGAE